MASYFAVLSLDGPALGKLFGAALGLYLGGYVLYLIYRACGLDSPVSIRLAHTATCMVFWVLFFTALPGNDKFRSLSQPGGCYDAVVVIVLSLVWLILLWVRRPLPQQPVTPQS